MKSIKIGIGVLLGLMLIGMYEFNISKIIDVANKKRLSTVSVLFKSLFDNRSKESLNAINHLTALCLLDSDLNSEEFIKYAQNEVLRQFDYIQLQYADARFDTVYTYSSLQKGKSTLPNNDYGISLNYGGPAMRRAIELQENSLQGPIALPDGRYGAAYWAPIFHDNIFHGIITGVFAFEEIFSGVLDNELLKNVKLSVVDGADTHIYGAEKLFGEVETIAVSLADRSWYVSLSWIDPPGVVPRGGRIVTVFAAIVVILLIGYLAFVSEKQLWRIREDKENLIRDLDFLNDKYEEEKSDILSVEKALTSSEERYRALFDNNPIQTVVVDNTCRVVMYNFAKNKTEGRKPVVGSLMYKDYAEHHEIDMFSELVKCIETGEQKEFPELKYKERYLHIHISPFSEGAIITSIDTTATKRLFDQLQQSHKMEAVGTLAGGIAHEFNNILGIIIGNVELAADEIENKNISQECLAEIRNASMRAKDVVRQLLSFSRQKNRKKSPLKISDLLEDSISNLVRPSIPSSIDIYSSIQKNIPMIMADPLQIQQVLINLCTNSSQAMEKEKGEIHIELKEVALRYERAEIYKGVRPGNYVQITVRDNGNGIEKDIQEKIFHPYFTTREVGQGTGMGLAIVHGIVTDHGGEIVFSSSMDGGTAMHVLFPPLIGRGSIA